MFQLNPLLAVDGYKTIHHAMYPDHMEFLQSNFTCRGTRIGGLTHTVAFGPQSFCIEHLIENFHFGFFNRNLEDVVREYDNFMLNYLGPDNGVGTKHIEALWELGYLPLRVSALPEGSSVPLKVPNMLIENTVAGFGWLVNYLETAISNHLWPMITSATTAQRYRHLADEFAVKTTGTTAGVEFQMHDFSCRGMMGMEASARSGSGHLLSFVGTDSIPAIEYLKQYYNAGLEGEMIGVSVPATEHSVACAGGKEDEDKTLVRIGTEVVPTGIFSFVADTWNLWHFTDVILPANKEMIMDRDGKLVIRPDSGDPVDILCGTMVPESIGMQHHYPAQLRVEHERNTSEERGLIQVLWDTFGGTVNDLGYKVLDEHIGAIYGDSITEDRAYDIFERLEHYGFASTNVVLGIGSYTYQYVTRDTHAMAMKATWCQVDGEGRDIWKDPVTDKGDKKSAKGRLAVLKDDDGEYFLVQQATPEEEAQSELRVIFENGEMKITDSLQDIRRRLGTA